MSVSKRPRRKSDGSYEIPISCPVCGSRKCEINLDKNVFHCYSCSAGGLAPSTARDTGFPFLSSKDGYLQTAPVTGSSQESTTPDDLTADLPIFALQEIKRRGHEPQWLLREYGVRWSHSRGRLWWPCGTPGTDGKEGPGGALRAVLPWERPKVLACPPKGLVGQHRLVPGARVVVTEGDWKSAAIPIPWVGVGTQGTELSQEQRFSLLSSQPASIFVMYDGGYQRKAQRVCEQLLPFKAHVVELPGEAGPDDIPRRDLVSLLLSAERKYR